MSLELPNVPLLFQDPSKTPRYIVTMSPYAPLSCDISQIFFLPFLMSLIVLKSAGQVFCSPSLS